MIPLRAATPSTLTKPIREPSEMTPPQRNAPAMPPSSANGSVKKISNAGRKAWKSAYSNKNIAIVEKMDSTRIRCRAEVASSYSPRNSG